MSFSASGRNDPGVFKVLRLHLRQQPLDINVVVAERAVFSFNARPQGALLCHNQGMLATSRYHAHLQPLKHVLCPHQGGCNLHLLEPYYTQLAIHIVTPVP